MPMKLVEVELLFKCWVEEGKRVGALSDEHDFELWTANQTGARFSVFEIGTDGKRYRMSNTAMPDLGKNTRTAYDALWAMRQAWMMIPRGTEAK